MNWYLKVLMNYVGFGGRARRMEYWMFTLITIIIGCILAYIDMKSGRVLVYTAYGPCGPLLATYLVGTFLPSFALQFRRLHDINRSAWWILINIIPLIGPITLLVFECLPGTRGSNRFGPDPITSGE